MRDWIFRPLGMRSSATRIGEVPASGDVASPHVNFGGEPRPVPRYDIANVRGAGAISSNALDMAQWLRFLLGGGQYRGRRLLGEATLAEILSPQTIMPPPDAVLRPYVNFSLYGLGTELMDYKGRKVVHHGGVIQGMHSYFALVPDAHLGVVVLTNTTGPAGLPPELPEAVTFRVLDAYLGGTAPDWRTLFLESRRATLARRTQAQLRREAIRVPGTRPTLDVRAYAGQYVGPVGTATVTQDGDTLRLHVGPITSRLEHWNYDTFRFWWDPIGYLFANITLDTSGRVDMLHVELVGEFKRTLP
jgi:CubicO group peptidase (beta-lactamase class C family)